MLNVYLTNLGKYTEQQLVGEWLKLPVTQDELQQAFKDIGLGAQYEEYFITDIDTDIPGLYHAIGEYENIYELNYLAERLQSMDEYDFEKYSAVVEYVSSYESTPSIAEYINLTYPDNLDNFSYDTGIDSDSDLGYFHAHELGTLQLHGLDESTKHLIEMYFDYEAYGSDININDSGGFVREGYVTQISDDMTQHYTGPDDLPDMSPPQKKSMKM